MDAQPPAGSGKETGPSPFDDAELYDALFGDYDFDRTFYLNLSRRAKGPVLEVACGTGRVLMPCLQAGVEIDGIDLSPAMIDRLKRKGKAKGLTVRATVADMRDFTLPRRYALVFIAFNGFVHALTSADQIRTLRVCREHLLPGGMLVFNVFFPGQDIVAGPQGVPVLETEAIHPQTGRTLRMYDTRTLDRIEQVQHSRIEIQELDPEGRTAAIHASETRMRWTYKQEMGLLLELAGFQRWEIRGGFDGRPLEQESDLMIVFAWRN